MTEKQRTKASEIVDDLMSRPLTPEEIASREPKVPKLRLRPDTPTIEIDGGTSAKDVLSQLSERVGTLAIREAGTEATAVILPVEQYLELAGKELARRTHGWVATPDGRLVPQESELAASHIEQVDPREAWKRGW